MQEGRMTRGLRTMTGLLALVGLAVLAVSGAACGGSGLGATADAAVDRGGDAGQDPGADGGGDGPGDGAGGADAGGGTDAGDDASGGGDAGGDAGGNACVDLCVLGEVNGAGQACSLWQPSTSSWVDLEDGAGFLENRSRHITSWLRRTMEPAGGIMSAHYSDTSLTGVVEYGNTRDSAIWTGTYLAAEALRYLAGGHPEALAHVEQQVRVLHRWFNISGDPGYLARYVAPANSPAAIQAIFSSADLENHRDWPYEGSSWHWKGHTSRDQYQGPLLGYSLAYEASSDAETREMIRHDVVELVEELMKVKTHAVKIVVNNLLANPVTIASINLDFQYSVFASSESTTASPEIVLDADDLGSAEMQGFQEFYPNLGELVSQIPLLSWATSIPRASSAIMLASYFLVALQVTDGVPAYAARRAAIKTFYEAHVGDWLGVAEQWRYESVCGAKYYGTHIAFEPMYNLARLEYDAARRERIRGSVLKSKMWDNGVATHKNVFFAWVHAANPPAAADVSQVVSAHAAQLAQFPTAPLVPPAVDLTGVYAEDPTCPGLALQAIDVGQRGLQDYMWQDQPWHLTRAAEPQRTIPGVDYVLAYWLGRRHGLVAKDATEQCLRWR
jgi:hypothetical protein